MVYPQANLNLILITRAVGPQIPGITLYWLMPATFVKDLSKHMDFPVMWLSPASFSMKVCLGPGCKLNWLHGLLGGSFYRLLAC